MIGLPHAYHAKKGEILYHYTSANAALSILRSQTFWLSEYAKTNDSSEYLYSRKQYIDAYQRRQVWIDDVPRLLMTSVLVGLESGTTMLIGGTTGNRDALHQWQTYADNGRGCVVGLDARYLQDRAGVAIRRISYDPEYLFDFVNSGLSMLQAQYEQDPNALDGLKELASFFAADLFAFKHPAFSSENEMRISRLLIKNEKADHLLTDPGGHASSGRRVTPCTVKERAGVFGKTRYIELPLSFRHHSAIKSIGFGPACSDETMLKFRTLAKSRSDRVEFWKSLIPYRS